MIWEFKSQAAPSVIMLDDLAQRLFGIIGHTLSERGVLTLPQINSAIVALETAIADEKRELAQQRGPGFAANARRTADDALDDEAAEAALGLAQRAWPFLDLLRRARSERKEVLWGV